MDTDIRVQYLNPCSAYAEPYWHAHLVENGERVWPDCYATSVHSAEEARCRLLQKLTEGRNVIDGHNVEFQGAKPARAGEDY